ncbi:HET domain-containing protein [Colletotrichum abscissum]|uniref:HET domain-containing protein n=1 Tax=Colletotrichum abscissum TaxID=1671311 RepID=A0A9P9XMD7_9PEZI|nr:HET domain-containing protein [Colletotrichum abscissum]
MPLRETDPDFKSEIFERAKAAFSAKSGVYEYELPLPTILGEHAEQPLPCQKPVEETNAISAHMSTRIHAYYEQLAAAYDKTEDPPASIGINLEIQPRNFEPEAPTWHHRRSYGGYAEQVTDIRPLCPLVPLQCLVHLPAVQEWEATWLWERPMPASIPSRVMREHYTWPWEGPLRDARHEFGASIMDQKKSLCGKRIPPV